MSNSIGNLKNNGLKGNNWPWQYKMLQGLQGIIDVISSTANGTEYEAELVSIDCPPGPVPPNPHAGTKIYLEVRVWNTISGGFTDVSYYLPGDNTAYPAADFAGCTITYLESGDATEATLQAIETILTNIDANVSTEATLELVRLLLVQIEADTTAIATSTATTATNTTGVARTPGMTRATGAGLLDLVTVVGSNLYSVSVANVGSTDATVLGATIKPNESLNFNADAVNNFFTTFTYNPLTSELLFIYVS